MVEKIGRGRRRDSDGSVDNAGFLLGVGKVTRV